MNTPTLCFPRSLTLWLLLAVWLAPVSASAQFIWAQKSGANNLTEFQATHPPLLSMKSHGNVKPFYRLLYIYGDGNFVLDTVQYHVDERAYQYNFESPTLGLPPANARLYTVSGYSGGQEPPQRLKAGNIARPTAAPAAVAPFTSKVASGRYLHLQRNADAKPDDTLVYIVSFKNISPSIFDGNILFFYNSKLRQVNALGNATTLSSFASLTHKESLLYRWVRTDYGQYSKFAGVPLGQQYNNAATFALQGVPPGQEVHLFVELVVDPSMESQIVDTASIEMDLMAVAISGPNSQAPPALSGQEVESLNSAGLQSLMASFGSGSFLDEGTSYSPAQDTIFSMGSDYSPGLSEGLRAIDSYTSTMALVRAHDPNYLQAFACACGESGQRKKVVFKVHSENDGFAPTSNVYIDMKLPAGVTADDIITTPFWVHPGNDPASVNFVKIADDSVRWEMPNFLIFPRLEYDANDFRGKPDSSTFAEITFFAYVDDPAAIDSIQACIRFDSVNNDAVCTAPTKIRLVNGGGANLLSCGDCPRIEEVVGCVWPHPCAWPWWLWLLAGLLLLLMLIIIWRRRNNT